MNRLLFGKILLAAIPALLCCAVAFAVGTFASINHNMTGSERARALLQTTAEDVSGEDPDLPDTLPSDFYVLLLGVDASENRRTGDEAELYGNVFRSDSIIVAHVNTDTKDISLCSLNRDIPTEINGYEDDGLYKLNAAYALGGVDLMAEEAEELTGVEIPYHAVIDMEGLESIIDSAGGIDVDVEDAFYDEYLNEGIEKAGMQHLDGHKALLYSRSRHAWVDDDYARTRHQREVLQALASQLMKNPDPVKLYNAATEISQHVATNLTLSQIAEIGTKLIGIDTANHMYSLTTPTEGQTYDGVWYEVLDEDAWEDVLSALINNDGGKSGKAAFSQRERKSTGTFGNLNAAANAINEEESAYDPYDDSESESEYYYYDDDGDGIVYNEDRESDYGAPEAM